MKKSNFSFVRKESSSKLKYCNNINKSKKKKIVNSKGTINVKEKFDNKRGSTKGSKIYVIIFFQN
ncbi:hypothetical protein PFDG_05274 [Plasmodium falciparum Dd2]|uniref:Uncharacterized protein n=1 Tax=Plasmodium falciparum (isolate Dd2) TaxID=57267 RepID=A0A0L7MA37_PLAF4|nr:hypothetical protein PFDG_05274 [Plasmodium falciparum Dd2]